MASVSRPPSSSLLTPINAPLIKDTYLPNPISQRLLHKNITSITFIPTTTQTQHQEPTQATMASTPSTLSHPMPTSLSIPTPNSTSPPLSPISNPKPPRVFTTHPAFTPDPHAPLIDEFNRLARQSNWSKKDPFRRLMWDWLVREEYQRLVLRVQDGSTGPQLSDWQRLCGELGVGGEWESIRKCKKVCFPPSFPDIYLYIYMCCILSSNQRERGRRS